MLSTPSESYVPFFHTKDHKPSKGEKPRYKKHPPPLPAPRKSTKGDGYHPSKEGYDNHGEFVDERSEVNLFTGSMASVCTLLTLSR